jgi:hypothetical protein
MKPFSTIALLALVALSGCKTTEQLNADLAANDDATCRGYGAKPGTDIYVQCRMGQDGTRAAQVAAAAQSHMAVMNTYNSISSSMARTYNNWQ